MPVAFFTVFRIASRSLSRGQECFQTGRLSQGRAGDHLRVCPSLTASGCSSTDASKATILSEICDCSLFKGSAYALGLGTGWGSKLVPVQRTAYRATICDPNPSGGKVFGVCVEGSFCLKTQRTVIAASYRLHLY